MCFLEPSYVRRLLKLLDPAHPTTDCELVGNVAAQAVDPYCCHPSRRLAQQGRQTTQGRLRASLSCNQCLNGAAAVDNVLRNSLECRPVVRSSSGRCRSPLPRATGIRPCNCIRESQRPPWQTERTVDDVGHDAITTIGGGCRLPDPRRTAWSANVVSPDLELLGLVDLVTVGKAVEIVECFKVTS